MHTHPSLMKSQKYSFISFWNVAGLLHNPKNITVGSYDPNGVEKAAFHSSPSLIWTLLYPHLTSNLVKYFCPRNRSSKSDIVGKGYALGIVPELTCLSSWHGLHSFL